MILSSDTFDAWHLPVATPRPGWPSGAHPIYHELSTDLLTLTDAASNSSGAVTGGRDWLLAGGIPIVPISIQTATPSVVCMIGSLIRDAYHTPPPWSTTAAGGQARSASA